MNLDTALVWASERKLGTLITIRRDGRPQSSDVSYTVVDGKFVISLTETRAKTKNIRADNRVVLHISQPKMHWYVSFDGTAELSPPAMALGDSTNTALMDYFEAVAGKPHPDWNEYQQAMIDEQRLLATLTPTTAVGMIAK